MNNLKSLYIHIPFCISKCKYCDFFSIPCNHGNVPDDYINALCNEIKFRLEYFGIKELDTIYIGGGTPSLLAYNQLYKIFEIIKKCTNIKADCEITIESNPDDITERLIENWKNIGINRISLGIQSFSNMALEYVSRRANADVNENALKIINNVWHGDLSADLICGLPCESKASFKKDLECLLKYKPDHISMYSLTIEEETPLGKELANGKLQYDFDFADDLWISAKNYLTANGYNHYEVSNFSLPGKECRHNLKYWNHQGYVGCGSGGAGSVYFDNGEGFRWTNINNIDRYIKFWNSADSNNASNIEDFPDYIQISENISLETSIFEFFMMGLRKLGGINENDFVNTFHMPMPEKIKK